MIRQALLFLTLAVSSTALSSVAAFAHEDESTAPAGATTVHLREEATMKVEQDKIIAIFTIEEEHKSPSILQNKINTTMTKALNTVKREGKVVEVSTGSYNINQIHKNKYNKLEEDTWRGSQTITLESLDQEKILELSSTLQGMGFATKSLSYTLSAEKARSFRDTLMAQAIGNIQKRAEKVSAQLGMPHITIRELNLTEQTYAPQPRMMVAEMAMMSKSADMAAPAIEGKEEEIRVSVEAKVYLEK